MLSSNSLRRAPEEKRTSTLSQLLNLFQYFPHCVHHSLRLVDLDHVSGAPGTARCMPRVDKAAICFCMAKFSSSVALFMGL